MSEGLWESAGYRRLQGYVILRAMEVCGLQKSARLWSSEGYGSLQADMEFVTKRKTFYLK